MRLNYAALILLSFGVAASAQSSTETAITISGSVKDSVTGMGIGGAAVNLVAGPSKAAMATFNGQMSQNGPAPGRSFPQSANLHTVTAEDGAFSFSLAEPTFAAVQISRSGYMPTATTLGTNFKSSIAVALVPLGVIEGRVVDSDGEPLAGIQMEVIQPVVTDGRKIYRPSTSVPTDDRGQFRLWNLLPGSVYLRAAGRSGVVARAGGAPAPPETDHAYSAVYFPNAADRQSATSIRILPGQSAHADFTLEAQKSYRIRGTIRNGSSYTRMGVRLLRGEDFAGNRAAVDTNTGAFVIYDVTPGPIRCRLIVTGAKVSRWAKWI